MKDDWFGRPVVMYGVQDLDRHKEQGGPKYAVGVVGVLPFEFIPMEVGGFEIIRNFHEGFEVAIAEKFVFRKEHVDWKRAERNGEATVKIARGMVETPGMRWLNMYPWGLMALGWEDTEEYFPGILERMQQVLTEVCGDIEFVDEPNFEFPTSTQERIFTKFGAYVPL